MVNIMLNIVFIGFFCWFCFRVSIKTPQNEKILTRIVKEVKGLNPSFDAANIRGNVIFV